MGLTVDGLKVLSGYLGKHPSRKVLSLGYPDILCSKEMVFQIFGVMPTKTVDTGGWHNIKHPLPETVEFFTMMGSELTCVDVHASRGVERIVDLNNPTDLGKFDIVIDAGTTEHCFNIAQAVMNAANAVSQDGIIFHTPPMTMINHGFYNICPTMLCDFYTQNGWKIEILGGVNAKGRFQVEPVSRMLVPNESSLYFVARRTNMKDLIYPTQTKYLKNPDLKASA